MTTPTTSRSPESIRASLIAFLRTRTRSEVDPDLDLFASGLVSSLFAMELLVHIEGAFAVAVPPAELRLENFRTVDAMTELVLRLAGGDGG